MNTSSSFGECWYILLISACLISYQPWLLIPVEGHGDKEQEENKVVFSFKFPALLLSIKGQWCYQMLLCMRYPGDVAFSEFHRWGTCGPERWSNLPEVTQQDNKIAMTRIHVCWPQTPGMFHYTLLRAASCEHLLILSPVDSTVRNFRA